MPAMISIDFGNSYSKVGIRRDGNSPTDLLKDDSLDLDEANICVPTLAARIERNGRDNWVFGNDVMRYSENTEGLTVYRNWKPQFFNGETDGALHQAVGSSGLVDGGAAAAPSQLTDSVWRDLKSRLNLSDESRRAIADVIDLETSQPEVQPEVTELDIKEVALGFFSWLNGFVDPVCRKRGLGGVKDIPVRISLPSFGSVTKAELLLEEVLVESGWKLADRLPTISEPLANAVGNFTEGFNATWIPNRREMPNYGKMFNQTGLLKVMREAVLHGGPKVSWTLVADLGGYTADFAMVCLNLEDIDGALEGECDGKPRTATISQPIGVTDLDARVVNALDESKQKAFEKLERDPHQRRLERFHRDVYSTNLSRPFHLRDVRFGDGEERDLIADCIDRFAHEIADYAEEFLEVHQYDQIDDLILTGGGCMIPAVRKALCDRLARYGVRKTHMYVAPAASVSGNYHRLDARLVRGATALGGASVYFDFAESD